MSISKPYKRIWRPMKGYSFLSLEWENIGSPQISLDYLNSELFAPQKELSSLVTTTHLIIRDLYDVFNYIEPSDENLNVYSHRLYELLLRTATEIESNLKGILNCNGYPTSRNMNMKEDYYKINGPTKLHEYKVVFHRWRNYHEFKPFEVWNSGSFTSLPWYKAYNEVKHNRYDEFIKANLENVMNAFAGLLCILHAQIGNEMGSACFESMYPIPDNESKLTTGSFTIFTPSFNEEEKYEFIWDSLKTQVTPVENYSFK